MLQIDPARSSQVGVAQFLQIVATLNTNCGMYYKLGQLWQIIFQYTSNCAQAFELLPTLFL